MTVQMIPIRNGSITIPNDLRERYGLKDGSLLVVEAGTAGIILRPVDGPEPEVYTPERIAEFLLNNAVSKRDYQAAIEEVIKMGMDPAAIPHDRPSSLVSGPSEQGAGSR